jgi:hypothetical protein
MSETYVDMANLKVEALAWAVVLVSNLPLVEETEVDVMESSLVQEEKVSAVGASVLHLVVVGVDT